MLTCFTLNSQMGPYIGTWYYLTLPQGLRSSPDNFNRVAEYYLNLQNGAIPGTIKVMDDLLLSAKDMPTLRNHAMELMKRLEAGNIKVSEQKIQIGTIVK